MMLLSIIIISYGTKNLTRNCLSAVLEQYKEELEKKSFEIIAVDNNSHDESVKEIKKQFGNRIKLIENKENLGFAKACNIGAESAEGKNLLFLNSDTEVLDKGFLSMAEFLEKHPKIGILGGKLENNDGSVQKSAGKFYNLFNLVIMLLGLERLGFLRSSPDKIQKVDWVSGACMMARRDIFKKLNGFDEKLFMYVEDMEICFRAKKFGFLTYFYPNLRLKHKSLGSSSRTFAVVNIYKGILNFYLKHKSHFEYLIAKLLLILKAEILIFIGFITLQKDLRERYSEAIRF